MTTPHASNRALRTISSTMCRRSPMKRQRDITRVRRRTLISGIGFWTFVRPRTLVLGALATGNEGFGTSTDWPRTKYEASRTGALEDTDEARPTSIGNPGRASFIPLPSLRFVCFASDAGGHRACTHPAGGVRRRVSIGSNVTRAVNLLPGVNCLPGPTRRKHRVQRLQMQVRNRPHDIGRVCLRLGLRRLRRRGHEAVVPPGRELKRTTCRKG